MKKAKAEKESHEGLHRIGRALYGSFLSSSIAPLFETRLFAAEDIWSKASSIMKDVYGNVMGFSTVAAIVTASIALLLMNFSKNGQTVDESRGNFLRQSLGTSIGHSMKANAAKYATGQKQAGFQAH